MLWLRRFGERETWCTDTQEAITAEVATALGITQGLAASYLDYSRAMRLRLPRVGELLVAGDIDYRTFQTIVYRTDLITDAEVLAAVDAELAVKVAPVARDDAGPARAVTWIGSWPAPTVMRCAVVGNAAAIANCRSGATRDGLTEIFGRLITTDAHAVDARLDALAATVCADDPRTRNQRRADAMGALAVGRRSAELSLRATRLPGRSHADAESGGDPRDRRSGQPRRHRADAGLDDRIRRADSRRTDRRPGQVGQTSSIGASRRCAAGARLHPVAGLGRFCPLPRFDVPVPRLRQARGALRSRPHHPARRRRAARKRLTSNAYAAFII